MQPCEKALDEPAALIASQMAAILDLQFAGGAMGRDHVDAVLLEVVIEPITVRGAIANEMFRLRLQHVEAETQLHQRDVMVMGRVRTH